MDPRILHMSTYLLKSSFQALDCIQKLLISQSALCSQSLGYPKLNPAFNMYQNDFAFSQGETSSSDTHEATPIDNTHSDVSDNSYDQVQIGGNYFNAQENFKMLSSLGSLINENREGLMRDSKKIHKESPSPSKNHKKLEAKQTDNFNTSKRQRWHEEEDTQLIALFAQHGPKWTVIASLMTGRTAKQIRDRYKNILRPDIKRNEWTQEEENLFDVLYAQYGNRWCKIAEHLPGRSENQVKNKFYSQRKNKEFQKISPSDESEDGLSKEASETKVEYENQ